MPSLLNVTVKVKQPQESFQVLLVLSHWSSMNCFCFCISLVNSICVNSDFQNVLLVAPKSCFFFLDFYASIGDAA